ncbi:hypothetical protein AAEU33_00165 [Chryseobacterium sp. Chry.R1]|uniref:hypothetical protein n=1 Tax=Chryseobacterium sp. Chry.R1 TaxID=3139392 RepID=UPI0031F92B41
MRINHYTFWIFKEELSNLLSFFLSKEINLATCFDKEQIKYELHQTDENQSIWFTLITNNDLNIKATIDSDDKNIILFHIEYKDNFITKIDQLKEYLSL